MEMISERLLGMFIFHKIRYVVQILETLMFPDIYLVL